MNDEIVWKVLWGLLAAVTGILGWLGKRHVDRLDELDREAARQHHIKEIEDRITSNHERMHADNQRRFEEIRDDFKSLRSNIERLLFRGNDR